jgi:hypothetical protein
VVAAGQHVRERWWKQILADPDVDEGLLAIALAISTKARWQDGTRALMSNRELAQILQKSDATVRRRTWQLQELGYLVRVERGGRRSDTKLAANVYDLSQPESPTAHPDERLGESPTAHGESPTAQNGAPTAHGKAPTAHPDERTLVVPSIFPSPAASPAGKAGPDHGDPAPPAKVSKQRARDAVATDPKTTAARRRDERLFARILEVDYLRLDGRRIRIAGLYFEMRQKDIEWPGRYLEKIDADTGVDDYLAKEFDMIRGHE